MEKLGLGYGIRKFSVWKEVFVLIALFYFDYYVKKGLSYAKSNESLDKSKNKSLKSDFFSISFTLFLLYSLNHLALNYIYI